MQLVLMSSVKTQTSCVSFIHIQYQCFKQNCRKVCVCEFGFYVAFNNFSVISRCDRELNAHFYSAASLKYHVPDT